MKTIAIHDQFLGCHVNIILLYKNSQKIAANEVQGKINLLSTGFIRMYHVIKFNHGRNRICHPLSHLPCSDLKGGEARVSAHHPKDEKKDQHDVVKPRHFFHSGAEAVGAVYRLFLRKLKMDVPKKQSKEEKQEQAEMQIMAA